MFNPANITAESYKLAGGATTATAMTVSDPTAGIITEPKPVLDGPVANCRPYSVTFLTVTTTVAEGTGRFKSYVN